MSRITDFATSVFNIVSQSRNNGLNFENRIQITSSTTFVVPPNTKAIKFTAVGGGQPAVGATGGPGAGYFEKTFYGPFVGLTTSFQLTVAAAGGNTVLANSAGTTIATAFGATAIGVGGTVGVGGTASGGDINSNGSPGGTNPGRGGASGGVFGPSVYDDTYAGRWRYFKESFTNDNVKNFLLTTYFTTTGGHYTVGINTFGSQNARYVYGGLINQASSAGIPGGLFSPGGLGASSPDTNAVAPTAGGNGGYGGNGGSGGPVSNPSQQQYGSGGAGGIGGDGGPGFPAGAGGYGGNGGNAAEYYVFSPFYYSGIAGGTGGFGGYGGNGSQGGGLGPGGPASGTGGAGGFGGGGGVAGNVYPPGNAGTGGAGGFGGGGGRGGFLPSNPPVGPYGTGGAGGAGAFIVEWTRQVPNKIGV